MEAGSSRSGGMPQVRCSASASQNVPGVRYLQRPRSQGRQVCGSGQVNSYVSTQEGSYASLLLFYRRLHITPLQSTSRLRPLPQSSYAPALFFMTSIEMMRFTNALAPVILYLFYGINSLRPLGKSVIIGWLLCGRMPFYERGCSYEHHHHHH